MLKVTIEGPKGSGKSTLAQSIKEQASVYGLKVEVVEVQTPAATSKVMEELDEHGLDLVSYGYYLD